jgi:nickel/cobalt transporter (NiCoT) family protein
VDISSLLPLAGLTFMLGLRHGMDPDHLAVVDNLTRYNAGKTPDRARWCGLFFSLGHGAMVTSVAALLALGASNKKIPHWVETTGDIISISFLFAIGAMNLFALLRAQRHETVTPRGLRAGLFGAAFERATSVSHPLLISLIGAAFAISMDTMSQAAVFSLAASGEFAWSVALLLGAIFTLGMLAVDAANGLWVYRLIASPGDGARRASRGLTLAIALLSLGLALFGVMRLTNSALDGWYAANTLALGFGCVALLAAVFVTARLRPAKLAARSVPAD